VRVHAVEEYYQRGERDFAKCSSARLQRAEIGTHAGAADTSLTLAVDRALVRADRLHDDAAFGAAEGVQGDPRRRARRAGKSGVDLIVARHASGDREATCSGVEDAKPAAPAS
jgi:creatinine amidohydrolase/Fe(II)-dependent formamide hydrolase-like protein